MQRDRLFVEEMIHAAERARELVAGVGLDELEADIIRREALFWNFTILGEAAAKISDEVRERHPEVEWRRPAETRNRIVHGYWSIDVGILYTTAQDQLDALVKALRPVLDELDSTS